MVAHKVTSLTLSGSGRRTATRRTRTSSFRPNISSAGSRGDLTCTMTNRLPATLVPPSLPPPTAPANPAGTPRASINSPNWRAGLRYEQLDSGVRDFGDNAAYLVVDSYRPKKASAMVDYSWSEFARPFAVCPGQVHARHHRQPGDGAVHHEPGPTAPTSSRGA